MCIRDRRYKGVTYGLPILGGVTVLYYNKAILDKCNVDYPTPKWNWDDFVDACLKIKEKTKGEIEPHCMAIGGGWSDLNPTFWPYFWQAGGHFLDDEDNPTKCTLNSEAGVEALQYMYDQIYKWEIVWKRDLSITHVDGVSKIFKEGKAAFMVIEPMRELIIAENPEVYDNIGVEVLPSGRRGDKYAFGAFDYLSISSISKIKDVAWEYLKFFGSPEKMLEVNKWAGCMPTRDDVPNPAPNNKGMSKQYGQIEMLRKVPPVKNCALIFDRIVKNIQRALRKEVSIKEALDDAAKYADKMMFE